MGSNRLAFILGKLNRLVPKNDNIILFYDYGRIGDNPLYIFKKLIELGYSDEYSLVWIVSNQKFAEIVLENGGLAVLESEVWGKLSYILKSRYYVTSTGPPLWKSANQVLISLWHGIPLKRLPSHFSSFGERIDYLITTSEFECLLMGFSFGMSSMRNCFPLGQPRCDVLFRSRREAEDYLSHVLDIDLKNYNKILIYLPTFRDYDPKAVSSITLELISNKTFQQYLSKNGFLFLIKPHPRDEKIFEKYESDHIKIVKNEELFSRFLTLYDILPAIDVLVTDYSSVYFDYLLLNRPVVFYAPDLEKYRKTRGFLLEPYENWTPGDKARTPEELVVALEKAVNNPKNWERERLWLRDVMFKYQDGKASERIIKYFWGRT